MTSVTRVVDQKVRLMRYPEGPSPIERVLARSADDAVYILAGTGDKQYEGFFAELAELYENFVFLNGRRPYDELKADLNRCLKWTASGALVAWDGLRQFGFDEKHLSGGIQLRQELKQRFPQNAEYLSGKDIPSGGIAVIVVK